jgi:hypothetical protein
VHTDPVLTRNLEFWAERVLPHGILCGHDYGDRFPDVQAAAHRLASKTGRPLQIMDTFWLLLPQKISESNDPTVVQKLAWLKALRATGKPKSAPAELVQRVNSIQSLSYDIILEDSTRQLFVELGHDLVVRGKLRNVSGCDWPVTLDPDHYLEIGAELYSGPDKTKVASARYNVDGESVRAGQVTDFEIRLSTIDAESGPASFLIDPLYRHIRWFSARSDSALRCALQITPRTAPKKRSRFWS